jgi:CheY-like chemotaxis protein
MTAEDDPGDGLRAPQDMTRDELIAELERWRAAGVVAQRSGHDPSDEELRIAMRMREELLAVVAHDLHRPLAAVATSAALLERQGVHGQQHDLTRIRRSAARTKRLIAELLNVSSMDLARGHFAIEPRVEDLEQLVITALEITSPLAAAKHLSLSSHVDRGSFQAWCDRERVIAALLNLLTNAIQFTAAGSISVRGRRCSADEVMLSVHDTGRGMSPAESARAFDPQAVPHARHDERLGLAIVKGIVELHGGRVWIDSALGRGSSVSFTLPARQPGTVDPYADVTLAPQVGTRGISSVTTVAVPTAAIAGPLVLLIDDESAVRESIADALRTEGYDVVARANGREALDYLDSAELMPALILLDLVMPVMDGWEFLRQQSRAPRIAALPVVLVSAHLHQVATEKLQQIAGHIPKPVRLAQLCEVVGNCAGPTP